MGLSVGAVVIESSDDRAGIDLAEEAAIVKHITNCPCICNEDISPWQCWVSYLKEI